MPVAAWAPEGIKTKEPKRYPSEFFNHCRWYEKNLKIIDKFTGLQIPFKLNRIQRYLEWLVYQADRKSMMLFMEVLKCRRPGVSTWAQACFFRRAFFHPNRGSIAMSCDQKSTDFIHEMTRNFALSMEEDCPWCRNGKGGDVRIEDCPFCEGKGRVQLRLDKDSSSGIRLSKNGSQWHLYTAGSRDRTGRGFGAHQLHMTEFDFTASEEFYGSVMQVTPNAWPTLVIIESTAQGPEGPMDRHRQAAVRGENGFIPVFIPWFDFDEYRMRLTLEELLRRPQAGPMEIKDARRWLDDNRKMAETVRDRLDVLRKERREQRRDQLEQRRLGGHEPPRGDGATDQRVGGNGRVRAPQEGRGPAEETAGTEGPTGNLPEKRGKAMVRKGTGPRRRVPGHTRDGERNLWLDYDRPDRLRGRALLDSERRNWETAVILGLAADDWRDYSRDTLKSLKKLKGTERFESSAFMILEAAAVIGLFVDSLSEYERDIIDEFDLDLEQIAHLRWFKSVKCAGSEVLRRHEYPSRPEESFEYPEESVMDPATLRAWTDLAKNENPKRVSFSVFENQFGEGHAEAREDPIAATHVWEPPEEGVEYAMGVDPSSGLAKGDWCVASVIRKDSGVQVAEFRSRMEPHRAIDQIEGLGLYYNRAFTGVEVNSIGLAFCRSLEDRGTLPMYERENPRSKEPGKMTRQIGWLSQGGQGGTRDLLITNARQTVREGFCRIRSLETLGECRTLVVNRTEHTRQERIEARIGCHDDGFFAWGIALMMRNRLLQIQEEQGEVEEPEIVYHEIIERLIESSRPSIGKPRLAYPRRSVTVVSGGKRTFEHGRRNLL